MQCRGHRSLSEARIDDDDLRLVFVPHDALPHDGMREAQVAADEDDRVGLLEIGVGVRRSVEAERLLVRDDRRGHALSSIPIAVLHPHAEFGERSEQSHLFGRHLSRADERDRFRPVSRLNPLHPRDECLQSRVPINRL